MNYYKILRAMDDGTYWVNGKGHYIPVTLIHREYAKNIRAMIRRRLSPEQYESKPLYVSLGRIRSFDLRLCDDDGMVSFEKIEEDINTLDKSYMDRHIRLQKMASSGREFLKRHSAVMKTPWHCTGHAHLAGAHIRCSSPAHQQR